jgi:hypothetical protein
MESAGVLAERFGTNSEETPPWDFQAAAPVARFVTPFRGFQCQCRDCQMDSGGGHSSVLVFSRATFEISGEVREIARTSDRGATKRKGFCPNCGVSVYHKPDKSPEFIGIYVGSLDGAVSFKPAIVLYASRGHAWDFLDPDIPKLPEWYPNSQ